MNFPIEQNYFMPPEWRLKQRTFMLWPARKSIWSCGFDKAKRAYADVANAIAEFEPVTMIINPGEDNEAKKLLSSSIELIAIEHDDSWFRDSGPTFLINSSPGKPLSAVCWKFNSWGEKFLPYDKDASVAKKLLKLLNIEFFQADIVMEGGSFHVDGAGTLITTEQCILNPNRNPTRSKAEIGQFFSEYLGVNKTIWLKNGIDGDDDTDGHVDNIACFTGEQKVVIHACYDKSDPNFRICRENVEILRQSTDASGRKFEIAEIEQPPARHIGGKRLALSYINYYPVNGGIILPVFGEDAKKTDDAAISKLKDLYPGRNIILVDGNIIITGGGNIHCITQQVPLINLGKTQG